MSDQIVAALIGASLTALLGGLGFLLRRLITREREREKVAELERLAAVANVMKAGDISLSEIDKLRRYAMQSGGGEVELTGSAAAAVLAATDPIRDEDGPTSQLGMNFLAKEALDDAEAELAKVLRDIDQHLDLQEAEELANAQRKWEEFKDAHAEFVSKLFEGGSMQPLWWITAKDKATRDRIRELEAYLEVRQL